MEADHTHYGITTQINSECQTEPSLIDPCSTNCRYPNAELAELSRPRNTETGNVQSDNQNNIDTPDQVRHNTYAECVSSIPTPPPQAVRPVMIIGDSILKHVYEDDFTDEIVKELTNKLDCKFLDNVASFTYADGEIDLSLYHGDGVHLNRKGTVKLINKLTIIGPICIRKKSSKMENGRSHMGVSNPSRNFYSQHRSNGTIHNNTSRYEHRQQRMRGFTNNDHQREYHRRPNRHPRTSTQLTRQDWQRECHRKENRQPVADHLSITADVSTVVNATM
ncbi:hypothetical protein BSL78_14115 [Apostichopus japonicus]|uniref:Uncharacterized protein n=1 Tax=Stichopus japonicus TaxID=307972 RepID=A0A2G8KLW5_STIJA|nr:hypothetical protein BSL78_14115 [Apostichopus japonicus]